MGETRVVAEAGNTAVMVTAAAIEMVVIVMVLMVLTKMSFWCCGDQ